MDFAGEMLNWYATNRRDLPWRNTVDAYVIWLSEIILQQTRVEQGIPYFHAFVKKFPSVTTFAFASEEEILRMWQGLGYYSRARNMHKASKLVVDKFDGVFPTRYQDLLKLPGVGDYSAAAISSFSSGEQQAVLDGNVFRVLSRYFGIETPINSTEGKKYFRNLAQELIPKDYAADYNQAIMDYGATICKPKAPFCDNCKLQSSCVAFNSNLIEILPVKNKAKKSRDRFFHYFVIEEEEGFVMTKRDEGDVWANLYEFPLIETTTYLDVTSLMDLPEFQKYFAGYHLDKVGETTKHILSHQNIYANFYRLSGNSVNSEKKEAWVYCLSENLDKLAKHKLIFSFINKYIID